MFALPLSPEKTGACRHRSTDLGAPQLNDYRASREQLGVTSERFYFPPTLQGYIAVVYLEG